MTFFNPRNFFELNSKRLLADTPEFYICECYGLNNNTLHKTIEDAGLSYLVLTEKDHEERYSATREDWIYVYDQKNMQEFLDKNKDILLRAEWPTQADNFIYYLSYVTAPANSEIFDLIHECYGGDSSSSDHCWLRRNAKTTPTHDILIQRQAAEQSRQRFKAFKKNDPKAAQWFLKIAMTGNMGAMEDVSRMYEQGRGFQQDMTEAAFWRRLIEKTIVPNKSNLSDIFSRKSSPDYRLTREQDAEIEKRVNAWRPIGNPWDIPVPNISTDNVPLQI